MIEMDEIEARVLGCLIEKEMTTPDYYPLTLNALVNACNQKSNRHPAMSIPETTVVRALDRLREKGLANQVRKFDSRVPKYEHLMRELLDYTPVEVAVMAELLLRGPQTLGELRGRASRMHEMGGIEEVQAVLDALMGRETGEAHAVRLPRLAGHKESRYAHLFCGPVDMEAVGRELAPEGAVLRVRAEGEEISALKTEVEAIRAEVAGLRAEFERFRTQFE